MSMQESAGGDQMPQSKLGAYAWYLSCIFSSVKKKKATFWERNTGERMTEVMGSHGLA
jgi:hypothetical protein